jgi:hypothetical protein
VVVLMDLPHIMEATVVPVPDETRGEAVKAYLVLQPGLTPADLSPQAIIGHCTARLARFKVPRYIAYVTELPKTPSGKIAKKVLIQGIADRRRKLQRTERRRLPQPAGPLSTTAARRRWKASADGAPPGQLPPRYGARKAPRCVKRARTAIRVP